MSSNPNGMYPSLPPAFRTPAWTPPSEEGLAPEAHGSNPVGIGGDVLGTILKSRGADAAKIGGNMAEMGTSAFSKAIPLAGAATGIYGMAKNKGALSNIGNGFMAGASIGSIVPGLGTLIGGGIGAAAGGIESLFNIGKPSAQEREGRTASADYRGNFAQMATPAQRAEAQKAVQSGSFGDLNTPLGLIVTRDALVKQGMTPEQAVNQSNQLIGNVLKGEQGGAAGIAQASSPINQILQKTYGSRR